MLVPINRSATAATGTATWVSTFAAEENAPGMVGASTKQNTMPVSVIETVKTYFITYAHAGNDAVSPRLIRQIILHAAKIRQVTPIQIFDWIVKYKKVVAPPIKSFPASMVVRMMPAAEQAATMTCSAQDKYLRVFIANILSVAQ